MMAFWEPLRGPRGPETGQWCIPSKPWLVEPICGVWNQIWCRTRLPEGQKSHIGVKQTPLTPLEPPQNPPRPPPNPSSDPPCNQLNPSSYLITHNHSKNPKISTETPKIPKTGKNGQKRPKMQKPKNCKNENWPILIPYDVYNPLWWQKTGQKHINTIRFGGAEWK